MEKKRCYKCKICQPINNFSFYNSSPDKHRYDCKTCSSLSTQIYYQNNKEQRLKYNKDYRIKNKEKISDRTKKYYYGDLENQRLRVNLWYRKYKSDINIFILTRYKMLKNKVEGKICNSKYLGLSICTKEEFIEYASNNAELNYLFREWGKNGYKHGETPSMDRYDSSLGYTIDNIQFITMSDNSRKGQLYDKYSEIFKS